MEVVVPGRGPAGSAYLYTWDEQGEVQNIEKVPKQRTPGRKLTSSTLRRSLPWPFQSSVVSRPSSRATTLPLGSSRRPRRSPSSGTPLGAAARPVSSIMDLDIVPDYVVNFLRGETPETVARRRERRERYGAHSPRVHRHLRNEQSCTADIYLADVGTADSSMAAEKRRRRRRTPRQVVGLMTGAGGGVALNVLLAFLILAAAIVCLILAATGAKMLGGESELKTGTCASVTRVNQGIHGAVNVLGFVLVAGGNYVFQVLSSPTRADVDASHAKRRWMDIGIPSLRNLRGISLARAVLAMVILVVAVSSQVIYNAITFTKQTSPRNSCALALNGSLLGVITILNLVSVLAMALALTRRPSSEPLVTLGDAVASFLADPDRSTRSACLISVADVRKGDWSYDEARSWSPRQHRWGHAASMKRWVIWTITLLVPMLLTAAALGITLSHNTRDAFSSLGLANSAYAFSFSAPRAGLAIIVALPQLLLALLYLTTNALLTVFSLSSELSRFAIPGLPVPLRVSTGEPLGAQTTSLYLTLPRPFSWLLFVMFAGMGFLLSQGFHLVDASDGDNAVGLSPLPLAVLLGLLLLVGVFVGGLSLRRYEAIHGEDESVKGNPLAVKGSSNSAILSAKCHRARDEGEEMVMLPLSWGVVSEGAGAEAGHAAFSSRPVQGLQSGSVYA